MRTFCKVWLSFLSFSLFFTASSCSINRLGVRTVANVLAGSSSGTGNSFTSDDDPELVGAALPFALKTYETVLARDPANARLALSTGSAFVMYANAFVQGPASMLPEDRLEERNAAYARAGKLYLRGRDYVLDGLEARHHGFRAALDSPDPSVALRDMKKDDVPYLYWAAAGWVAAFSVNPLNLELMATVPKAAALMNRAWELDPAYGNGAIYDFYISFDAAVPASLGGRRDRVDDMFSRAVAASGGMAVSPYLSYAVSVCIPAQDVGRFRELLGKALAIDPDAERFNRLANTINQRKARWYLDHLDLFFIDTGEEEAK